MIAPNHNLFCKQAEPYYYDLLCDESRPLIPQSVVNHTEQCQDCRERINKLKAALSQADTLESERGQVLSAVTAMLKLHFAYFGKPVTCNIVKPFLPCLLDPALEIRIPTPIITHLLNCQQCSEDLDIIRCLNLNSKQLCRLSQLFAEKPAGDNIGCSKARNAIPSVVSMVFSEVDSEVLKHLCKCPVCRELLYKERQKNCGSLPEDAPSPEFPCESVSTTDIFDYVVPYGLGRANDQYAKFRKSFTLHAATCPHCQAKMQTLHKTIYNIVERAESDVVTVYHIDESAKVEACNESDDTYAGFPIKVETVNREDEVNIGRSASTIGFGAALKQRVSAMKLKSLAKTAVAAAAVVLIAAALFLSTQTATAVTIDQIYKALEKVQNVHISMFVPDRTEEPIQERWVSRALNIYMTKTGKQLVLSDITKGVRIIQQPGTGVTETRPLTEDNVADIEKQMTGSLGLMPFYDMSEIPKDAEWSRVADDGLKTTFTGTEVYDLIWRKYSGSVAFKWRFFVDPKTKLPQKTEFYKKLAVDDEYTRESVIVVEYLGDSEIRAIFKDFGF
jgi:outer membrane lipoprotein-sorting protein